MASEKKQITRNRVSLSCQTCRRRKVKCGKQHPICASCEKAGEQCTYGDSEKLDSLLATNNEVLSSRKRQAPENDDEFDSEHISATSMHAIRAMEQKLHQLSVLLRDLDRLTPVSNENSPGAVQRQDYSFKSGKSNLSTELSTSRSGMADMTLGEQQSQALNSDSLLQVLEKLDTLNALLKSNVRAEKLSETPLSHPVIGIPSRDGNGGTIENRQSSLLTSTTLMESSIPDASQDTMAPSDEEANVLFRSWLWSVYPVFPYVSPHRVLEKYTAFRAWYRKDLDKGLPNPDPSFMPFMLVMWYTGQINLTHRARKKWFPWIQNSSTWYRMIRGKVEEYLRVMQTDGSQSMWTLAAAIMYSHLTLTGQDIAKSNVQNAVNIRSAQVLGLHNERIIKGYEPHEAETRRRLWWEILSADASLSLNSGTPTMVEDCYTDTKEPSELKDIWLGTSDAARYETHLHEAESLPDRVDDVHENQTSSLVSIFYLVLKARGIATMAMRRILRVNMSAQPLPMSELKDLRKSIAIARKQIEEIINRIPTRGIPEFDFVPSIPNSRTEFDHLDSMKSPITKQEIKEFLREEDKLEKAPPMTTQTRTVLSAFHKWARISLSTIIDGLEGASYAPFLRNSKSRLWAVSRNCALRVAHSFLRKYLSLAEAGDLRGFRWTWPLLFHPMHVTIILLVDLHDRPHSNEACRSRALVDRILSIASPGKGVIDFTSWPATSLPLREGGEEACTMIRKLRHKAWHKAGLDPDVLWTEEDQMSVGVGKALSENDLFIRSLREDIITSHKERIDRLFTGERSLLRDPASQKMRNDAVKQYLHPSQIGPGERVTGSVTQSMIDGDSVELPRILLLRARHDQELLPAPPTTRLTSTSNTSGAIDGLPSHLVRPQSSDSGEVLHLGDLIRRIKKTSNMGQAPISRSRPKQEDMIFGSIEGHTNEDTEPPDCMFRSQQRVMDVALQELADRHTMADNLPIHSENAASNGPAHPLSDGHHFADGTPGVHQNIELHQSGLLGGNPDILSFQVSDTPMDTDFDWARWDEMFGTYDGFEDLLMDLATDEIQQNGHDHGTPVHVA